MTDISKLNFDSCGSISSPVGSVSVYAVGPSIVYLEMAKNPAPNDNHSPVVVQALQQLRD